MLHKLTDVVSQRGVRFVKTKRLAGRKYAVQFSEADDVIYVSPAVHDLLDGDAFDVGNVLRVKTLPGHGYKLWSKEAGS